ncbi:MAG: SLBB domain-containing protein [Vicinamibacterales bacterium]
MALSCVRLTVLTLIGMTWLPASVFAAQSDRVVSPRDQLTITVFNEPTLTGKYIVDMDGTFEFPLVGRFKAGDLRAREIELGLTKMLANGYIKNPQVTVQIEQDASQRVFVMGEVRAPGPYQFAGELSLIEALARAGSTATTAAPQVLVIRPARDNESSGPILPSDKADAEVIRINLSDLQSGGLTRSNITLRDGDTVFVPRAQLIYISGQVRNPGAYPVESGMTLLQALSLAGGVTDKGAAGRSKVIRDVNGKKKELKLKLTDLVKPGDTIVVPDRFF